MNIFVCIVACLEFWVTEERHRIYSKINVLVNKGRVQFVMNQTQLSANVAGCYWSYEIRIFFKKYILFSLWALQGSPDYFVFKLISCSFKRPFLNKWDSPNFCVSLILELIQKLTNSKGRGLLWLLGKVGVDFSFLKLLRWYWFLIKNLLFISDPPPFVVKSSEIVPSYTSTPDTITWNGQWVQ